LEGIIIVDKPKGLTSTGVLNRVKRLLCTKEAGHTGTLDPFATGVLPICLSSATKIIPFLNEDFKEYEATMRLGVTTDTLDETGAVISEKPVGAVDEDDVREVFHRFTGEMWQTPPMFSAVKIGGVRLYELARRGEVVERRKRLVEINELRLLEYAPPFLRFFVRCSRGTYVRVLAFDVAQALGCGGHLTELRRLRSGSFDIKRANLLEELEAGKVNLVSIREALSHLVEVEVPLGIASMIANGGQLRKKHFGRIAAGSYERGDRALILQSGSPVAIVQALSSHDDLGLLGDDDVVFKTLRVLKRTLV
jgi:tRNA pseudouridine55 synthase